VDGSRVLQEGVAPERPRYRLRILRQQADRLAQRVGAANAIPDRWMVSGHIGKEEVCRAEWDEDLRHRVRLAWGEGETYGDGTCGAHRVVNALGERGRGIRRQQYAEVRRC
jgi:hypothetical protein